MKWAKMRQMSLPYNDLRRHLESSDACRFYTSLKNSFELVLSIKREYAEIIDIILVGEVDFSGCCPKLK